MIKQNLVDKLEAWGFEDGLLIFKDFSLGAILELRPRDISTATDEFLNSLHGLTCDFLNGLKDPLSVQFVQVIDRGVGTTLERHEALLEPTAPVLAEQLLRERIQKIRSLDDDGQIPNQKLYLVLRRPFVRSAKRERRLRLWEKKDEGQEWAKSTLEPEVKLFRQVLESTKKGLETLGILVQTLPESAVFEILFANGIRVIQ